MDATEGLLTALGLVLGARLLSKALEQKRKAPAITGYKSRGGF